jgi:hypothetical protein
MWRFWDARVRRGAWAAPRLRSPLAGPASLQTAAPSREGGRAFEPAPRLALP